MPKLRLQNIRKQRGGEIVVNKRSPHPASCCHVASLTLGTRSQAEVSNLSKFDYDKGRLNSPMMWFLDSLHLWAVIMSVGVSMCRFRKQLPKGHGKMTIGSGCVVHRKFNSDGSNSKEDVFLVTTTQVVTKQELLAKNTGITVEFLNKRESFSLDSAEVFDIPDPVHGGVLAGMESSEAKRMQQESAQVSFIFIPVHKFDSRNVLVKKFIPFITFSLEKKRAMPSRSQSDEILQSFIASRKVLCHVLSDSGRGDGYYNTEPYCLEFRDETNDFILTTVTDRDGAAIESQKDLHREEKPWGAILMNEEGEFVGMLAVGTSQQKKLYPLFLPTLAQDNQSSE